MYGRYRRRGEKDNAIEIKMVGACVETWKENHNYNIPEWLPRGRKRLWRPRTTWIQDAKTDLGRAGLYRWQGKTKDICEKV
ncbi:hypothetical protein Trydic_g21350 [Trypoxylus dichotomus]